MLVTIFRGAKFEIEILKTKMIMKVAKTERYEKNHEIENSFYITIKKIYFIKTFTYLSIFATFMIILAFKFSILSYAALKMVSSIYIYYK